MSLREKVGIESRLEEFLPHLGENGVVRARFRISNEGLPANEHFAEGDWLEVRIVARVYDPDYLETHRSLSPDPLAEGDEISKVARTTWGYVELPLPSLPHRTYPVVAKVYSADERYRKLFEPSRCYAAKVDFGFETPSQETDGAGIQSHPGKP